MNNCCYAITIPADCLTLSFDNLIPVKKKKEGSIALL